VGIDYSSLSRRPWFQSRHWQPALDLASLWQTPKPSLASHSNPQSSWRSLSPKLSWAQKLFWQHATLSPIGQLEDQTRDLFLAEAILQSQEQSQIQSLVQIAAIHNRLGETFFTLSSVARRSPGDFVYLGDDTGLLLSKAEQLLSSSSKRNRLLDICCGSGSISLGLSSYFDQTLGSDLNLTAIKLANSAAQLNQLSHSSFVCGRSYEAVQGKFDWVVGNPPALPGVGQDNLYAFGGGSSTEITEQLVAGLPDILNLNGQALFLTFSPDGLLFEKLSAQLPAGFSLNYQVRRRFHGPWKHCQWIDHVWVHLLHDRRSRIEHAGPSGWEQFLGLVVQRRQPADWIERLV
jgi:methylase of polypeptide subunit release factors